jgi:hypothetical protein
VHYYDLALYWPPATRNGGSVREPGVRPLFWITIATGVLLLLLVIRGYWEWAVVGLIAVLVLNRLPFVRWR